MVKGGGEEKLPELVSILERYGPPGAMPVLQKLISSAPGTTAFQCASTALRKVVEAGDDLALRGNALLEPMTLGLEDSDPQIRRHASYALRLVQIASQPPPRTLAALGACLSRWESFPEVARNSASVLWGLALRGHDISTTVDALKAAFGSTDHWTREAAAEA
ncbi:MAG: hypothetical protein Q6370_020160, partial [Candidatus Sigynarchaeota archaeon]